MSRGILLYGPPASGKDTVTAALCELSDAYCAFTRLKIGSGGTHGYRMGSADQLAELEARGEVIYRNDRYGNIYLVDRPGLVQATQEGRIPILHLGQIAGLEAVVEKFAASWTSVLLWCSRESTEIRSKGRGDSDTEARLTAWDATAEDIKASPDFAWDLQLDTEAMSPAEAAQEIDLLTRRAI
ncbi:guanylate kinase [Streptomyces sp. VMFN-G11Ma]|jgi:guanylate kinase|uniref:guanylate kinase n=1 Tax=Streptomyces sp. VMFN-G11Ma TaxID=2135609 RepID=UPI000D3B989B|nr:guanylate kinase [Streptomyces sp. VMFN-G11Ma]PTM99273.1 guanylate kinase [Streptomyces sp. VMFN-G11Ma]